MRVLFIVNPISGYGWGKKLPEKIKTLIEFRHIDYTIRFTEYAGHARIIAKEAVTAGEYTHIIAVGGDGTVSEVGTSLYGSEVAFGIVSLGSGNGFARHLGYSLSMKKALKQILLESYAYIDMLEMNGVYFLNVSGVGFDAEVAHEFNRFKTRGILSYLRAGIKMWFQYTGKTYKITYDGHELTEQCFILSFANSTQYGNNARIAPQASLRDGLMDLCLLKRPSYLALIPFLIYLLNSGLTRMKYFKEIQCKEAVVEGDIRKVHVDGEALEMRPPIRLKVHRNALKMIVPKFAGKKV